MNADVPISHRPAPGDAPTRDPGSPPAGEPGGPPSIDKVTDQRWEAVREKLKTYGPIVGYVSFFFFALFLFVYWTFPYDRVRDRIIAEFEKSQKVPPGGARQSLTIGRLEPSWFTGVVLKDVALTTIPADPTKPSSTMRADEVRLRVSLGSLFSSAKDLTFSAKALGGTIEGSVTHKASVVKEGEKPPPGKKDAGPHYDRTIKMELDGIALNEVAPLRDAVGSDVGGTLKGSIDITYLESKLNRAEGTINLEVENFWVSDGKKPFKVPALKAVFGSEDITLPQMVIGNLPIQISVKSGVARVEKMEAKGKDVDLVVDGQITLRENVAESDLGLGLKFKFNDTYRKKGEATAGLLMLLDSEPKLRASKRPDGFYSLRVAGLLGGTPQIIPAPGAGPMPMAPKFP